MNNKKKALTGLLALPLMLGACEVSAHVKVNEDKTMDATMEIHDTQNFLAEFGTDISCDDLAAEITEEENVTIEDISTDDHLACRISGTGAELDSEEVTETDETFILTMDTENDPMSEQDLAMFDQFGINFEYAIEMPGDIIRAEGAEIDGNVATFTDIRALNEGIEVEGYKTADGTSGSSPVLWIVLGLVALAAIVGALLFFRNKNKAGAPADQSFGGQQDYGQPQGQQGYGQQQAGPSAQDHADHDLNNPEPPTMQR